MKSHVPSPSVFITHYQQVSVSITYFIVVLVIQAVICDSFFFYGCVPCYLSDMFDSVFNIGVFLFNVSVSKVVQHTFTVICSSLFLCLWAR